jgi:hypothetical protein
MKMTVKKYMAIVGIALAMVACDRGGEHIEFAIDRTKIEVSEVGGTEQVQLSSSDDWIASTDNTWITISPANGRGSTPCKIIIDSALTASPRTGVVRIENTRTWKSQDIVVEQRGYPYTIEIEDNAVELSNFEAYGKRYFDVRVRSNVDFEIDFPDNAGWLTNDSYRLTLDRGARPREVTVRFNWDINTSPRERLAEVAFRPKSGVTMARQDALNVRQEASAPIVENTREGDSVALLSIARAMGLYTMWDASTPMSTWNNVTLWEEQMAGCTPDKVGRVRSVEILLFHTREKLPYEVRYLTAAEEIYIFGNTNTFMLNLELGDDIAELTQLRRLTVGSYGLIDLPQSLAKLKNLEHLDVSANNFQTVPEVLTKENFPKLRTLIMNANQRSLIYDLSNSTRTNVGGFIDEPEFPTDLIKWDLDTLVLSVNYLQGELPTFEDDPEVPYYTQEEIDAVDTLPQFLVDHRIKKVMPSTKRFAINFNRLYGNLPDWLLYHPALDWWVPYSLVFQQEGRARNGRQAMFDNEPANLNYYYEVYTFKQKPTGEYE